MTRLAIVRRSRPSSWVSCQSITGNLVAAYHEAFPEAEFREFALDETVSRASAAGLAERILEFSPDRLVHVDHAPHPGNLLGFLREKTGTELPFSTVFHVFGDFTMFADAWWGTEEILRGQKTRFVCASRRQAELLGRFVEKPEGLVRELPFPVNASFFRWQPEIREEERRAKGLSPRSRIFLYSGRLSLQKNVASLLKVFSSYVRHFDSQAELWLAGPVDDLGIPYLGKFSPRGLLSYDLAQMVERLFPGGLASKVRFLGDLEAPDLLRALHAADAYVSFSTHNDEDFGMAPAEAALCGLPLLLTDWGGFSSFRAISETGVRLVKVKKDGLRAGPDENDALAGWLRISEGLPHDEARAGQAKRAFDFCSIGATARGLRGMDAEGLVPFAGFTPLFRRVAQAYRLSPKAPFLADTSYSMLYREVYGSYG